MEHEWNDLARITHITSFRAQQCRRVSDISDVLSGVIVAASVTCLDNFNFNLKFKTKWHQQCCYEIRLLVAFRGFRITI